VTKIENLYIDDTPTEEDFLREKHPSIERTDNSWFLFTDLPATEPPPIPMKLDMPILEKQIAEKGMHPNEKSKSKTSKKKPNKVHSKSNRTAVEKV